MMTREKKIALMTNLGGVAMGVQILVEGADKLTHFREFPFLVSFLFLAGIFIIAGTFLHTRLERKVKNVEALFHLIEGGVLMASALFLFEQGKVRMPIFILFMGILYVILGLVHYQMKNDNREKLARKLVYGLGLFFLLAGLLMIVTNFYVDRDGWVFGVGGLIFMVGLFYTLFGDKMVQRLLAASKGNQHPPHIDTRAL